MTVHNIYPHDISIEKREKYKERFIEFGKVLEHAAKTNPEKEIYFFQKFTEFVNSPSRNILLLTTLHQNFSAYAGKLNLAQRNEWNKVKGRFQEVVFAEPVEQLLFLAAEHISSEFRYNITDSSFRKIHALAVDRKFISADCTFDTACKLYPMDTFASYAITRAIQRYGQNERSLFSFLNSKDKSSISAFAPSANISNRESAPSTICKSLTSPIQGMSINHFSANFTNLICMSQLNKVFLLL